MTYTEADYHGIRTAILSVVSGVDLLDNDRALDSAEESSIRDHIEGSFDQLDRLGVPYVVQNAAISAGSRNNRRRPASFIVREIMDNYAHRLTPEARREWYELRAAVQQQQEATA